VTKKNKWLRRGLWFFGCYAVFFLFQRFVAAPFSDSHWFLYLINEGAALSNEAICTIALLASLLLARNLKLFTAWFALSLVSTALILNPCFGTEKSSRSGKKIKVLTYNIAHCRVSKLESISRVIADVDADIVCLQEASILDQHTNKFADYLKKTFPGTHVYWATNNLILSKFPIKEKSFVDVPTMWDKKQFPEVVVSTPFGNLRVICVHCEPSWVSPWNASPVELVNALSKVVKDRTTQQRVLAERMRISIEPLIVAGDFNATAQSEMLRSFLKEMADSVAVTSAGFQLTLLPVIPYTRIDFVLTKRLSPLTSKIIKTKASDHLPTVVEIEF
jgi:endonuclease/exonuclease/phosphatase family metal-dependent hydrolase